MTELLEIYFKLSSYFIDFLMFHFRFCDIIKQSLFEVIEIKFGLQLKKRYGTCTFALLVCLKESLSRIRLRTWGIANDFSTNC